MKTKEQEEADAAFIEKIKTLAFHVAKQIEDGTVATMPPCPECGKPVKLVAVAVEIPRPRRRDESHDRAFSA
jgi:hypothetical protein